MRHVFPLMFQVLFYTGSWIGRDTYRPLLEKLNPTAVLPARPVLFHPLNRNSNSTDMERDTILVGHSLGGWFALRDAMRFQDRVAGVVLINSHFNGRGAMPYPGIDSDQVVCPVLTLLGGQDERLPVDKAMDDLLDDIQTRRTNRYVIVHPHRGHFSGIADNDTIALRNVTEDIHMFMTSIKSRNTQPLDRRCRPLVDRLAPRLEELTPFVTMTSRSSSLLDEMLRVVGPRYLWKWIHWWWFLLSKPTTTNHYMHEDAGHVLWKGDHKDLERLYTAASRWSGEHTSFQIEVYQLPSVHPAILAWLSFPLFPRKSDKDNILRIPVLVLKVNENISYYKIPHPHRIMTCLFQSKKNNNEFNTLDMK